MILENALSEYFWTQKVHLRLDFSLRISKVIKNCFISILEKFL